MKYKNAQKTKENILTAAEFAFSEKGIYGTRVDDIAARAHINKRMIYEYFGNKEELYKAVLVRVYSRLGEEEFLLLSEHKSSVDTIKELIALYFNFLKNNPTYVNLLLWENLNKGQYVQDIDFSDIRISSFDLLREVINIGKAQKIFKAKIDTEQIMLSLLTYTFSYFSNRYTLSKLLGRTFDDDVSMKKRIEDVTEMFLNYIVEDVL